MVHDGASIMVHQYFMSSWWLVDKDQLPTAGEAWVLREGPWYPIPRHRGGPPYPRCWENDGYTTRKQVAIYMLSGLAQTYINIPTDRGGVQMMGHAHPAHPTPKMLGKLGTLWGSDGATYPGHGKNLVRYELLVPDFGWHTCWWLVLWCMVNVC